MLLKITLFSLSIIFLQISSAISFEAYDVPHHLEAQNQLLNTPSSQLNREYVGELQERWTFPSDHLPIGVTVQDANSHFRIISWNVLNSAYLKWIYENSQGFAGSSLTEEDIPIKENGLTLREQHVIDIIQSLKDSNSVLCLQECSELFIQELKLQLPPHIKAICSSDTPVRNQNIILYDTTVFEFIDKTLHTHVFSSEPARPLMEVILEKNGVQYRIFNVHLRCDEAKQQRFDLAEFIYARKQKDEVTVVLGDLNVERAPMIDAFDKTSTHYNQINYFLAFSPYKTTVSPELESKAIDHIFLDPGLIFFKVRENNADEILEGLQYLVDLLNPT